MTARDEATETVTGAGKRRLRILYVSRLFTGLESSVATGQWQPTGVPTIHKILEALAGQYDVQVLLADKDSTTLAKIDRDRDVSMEGLPARVRVLTGSRRKGGRSSQLGVLGREVRQGLETLRVMHRFRPDIVYCDHANVLVGAAIAKFFSTPVLFRVMGVYPAMRDALTAGGLGKRLYRLAYRQPFAHVLCTDDGSDGSSWCRAALAPDVTWQMLLNGVDAATAPRERTMHGRPLVLAVGKVEREKGADRLVEAALSALARDPNAFDLLIVGAGSLLAPLRMMVEEAGFEKNVRFIERVPHSRVNEYLGTCDIYVSLNRFGNLSNANLEAMRAGCCMVVPRSLPAIGVTNALPASLPSEAVATISHPDAVTELSDLLLELAGDASHRDLLSREMATWAARELPDWDTRVAKEIALIESLADRAAKL